MSQTPFYGHYVASRENKGTVPLFSLGGVNFNLGFIQPAKKT